MDYALTITHPSLQAVVNSTVNFNGMLTSLNGYNSAVSLSCGQGAPPTCSAAPASVVPTASGAPFIVTVGSSACGIFSFNIVATGTDAQKTTHLFPVTFTATSYTTPNYTLEVIPQSQTASVNTATIFNGSLQGTDCYNSVGNSELRVEPSAKLHGFPKQRCAHRESRAGRAVHRNREQQRGADLQLQYCERRHGRQQNCSFFPSAFYLYRQWLGIWFRFYHHVESRC